MTVVADAAVLIERHQTALAQVEVRARDSSAQAYPFAGHRLLAVAHAWESFWANPVIRQVLDELVRQAHHNVQGLEPSEWRADVKFLHRTTETFVSRAPEAREAQALFQRCEALMGPNSCLFVIPLDPGVPVTAGGDVLSLLNEVRQTMPLDILNSSWLTFEDIVKRWRAPLDAANLLAARDVGITALRCAEIDALLKGEHERSRLPRVEEPGFEIFADPQAVSAVRTGLEPTSQRSSPALLEGIGARLMPHVEALLLDLLGRVDAIRTRATLVRRYKARCEWHDRRRLIELADTGRTEDDGRGPENRLRDEMTRWLFDQGLSPLSEVPITPLTRSDVLSFEADTGGPFFVEVKQYKTGNVKAELRKAFAQALTTVTRLRGIQLDPREAFIIAFRRTGGGWVALPEEPVVYDGIRWHCLLIDLSGREGVGRDAEVPSREELNVGEVKALLVAAMEDGA